jgi:UDP-glucose 4-epimerase
VKWGPLEEGEIANESRLHEVLALHQPAAVMHFAAFAYVGESVEKPLLYYQNNIAGSAALLRALVDWRTVPVVFSSTCATYGTPERIPITEDHPQSPINPYGYSKLVVERMLADIGQAHRLRSVSLRYFNAAGADPDGDIGEAHDPEPHLIPRVLRYTGRYVRPRLRSCDRLSGRACPSSRLPHFGRTELRPQSGQCARLFSQRGYSSCAKYLR